VHLLPIAFGYVCGSIPFGLLLARRAGVDVRRVGSGNIGAANVARSASTGLGVATLALDAAKGAAPVALARWIANDDVGAAAGLAAFLGHVFPLFLGLAGGKGVATALGVLAVLCPPAAAAGLALFVVVFGACRYVSAASIAGAVAAPVVAFALSPSGKPGPSARRHRAAVRAEKTGHADEVGSRLAEGCPAGQPFRRSRVSRVWHPGCCFECLGRAGVPWDRRGANWRSVSVCSLPAHHRGRGGGAPSQPGVVLRPGRTPRE
jgi:glycerol-3-phosphate acyltransferase PlsY